MSHGPERARSSNPDFEFVRDYSALNKAALEAGMTTSKEQSRFRLIALPFVVNVFTFFLLFVERCMISKRKSSFVIFHCRKKHGNSPMIWSLELPIGKLKFVSIDCSSFVLVQTIDTDCRSFTKSFSR